MQWDAERLRLRIEAAPAFEISEAFTSHCMCRFIFNGNTVGKSCLGLLKLFTLSFLLYFKSVHVFQSLDLLDYQKTDKPRVCPACL